MGGKFKEVPKHQICQHCDTLVCEFSFLFYFVRGCTNACLVITLVYILCGKWGGFLNLINFLYSKFSSLSKAFIPNRSLVYGLYSPNARMILALFNVTSNSTNPIIVHKVFIEVYIGVEQIFVKFTEVIKCVDNLWDNNLLKINYNNWYYCGIRCFALGYLST